MACDNDPRLKNTTWKLLYIKVPYIDVSTKPGPFLEINDSTFSESSCQALGGSVSSGSGKIFFKETSILTGLYVLNQQHCDVADFWNKNISKITRYRISNDTLYLFGETDNIKLIYHKGKKKATAPAPLSGDEIYAIVEKMPEYHGGMHEMHEFIKANLKIPDEEKTGTVYVTFVIDKSGKITQPTILRSIKGCQKCDEEAIRLVSSMPNWIPGEQSGKKVNVQFNLPIRFSPK